MVERYVSEISVRLVPDDYSVNRAFNNAGQIVCDISCRDRCAYDDDFLVLGQLHENTHEMAMVRTFPR